MPMIVTVKQYLDRIETVEKRKSPAERRRLPSKVEIAEAADVTRPAVYKWFKNSCMNEKYFDAIITKMRAYGFDTDVGDLLRYEPPKTE